ncbi:tungsten ABC transporter substrate-binding protein [Geomonas sp. Red276]
MNLSRRILFTLSAVLVLSVVSLLPALAADKHQTLILATTTSTQDSGLLDVLVPMFEKQTGYFVKTISIGSGQAMKMGERGEADVLLVHSPEAEKGFMAQGFGSDRKLVMHNDFLILGPKKDPAGIARSKTAAEAFNKIAKAGALFLSRGDNSGTHAKEKALWKTAGINPEGQKWYQQTGLGMGDTLNVAAEKGGYLLADRGTYLALNKKRHLGLEILVAGEPKLLNVYHVIVVNPAKWPKVNNAGAKAFADFIVSPRVQAVISRYGMKEFRAPLFFSDAGKKPEALGL